MLQLSSTPLSASEQQKDLTIAFQGTLFILLSNDTFKNVILAVIQQYIDFENMFVFQKHPSITEYV